MPAIRLTELCLAFGTDQILNHANLVVEPGEKLALAGRNGAGKSTLLSLIQGSQNPDDGEVWVDSALRIAALPQQLPLPEKITVFEAVHQQVQYVSSDTNSLPRQRPGILADTETNYKTETILSRLGLPADATLDTLSGGWLKRVAIAQSLVQEPDIWILDEPTNHLDLVGIEWLEKVMRDYRGTLLFVSHDRALMQSAAKAMIEIDRGQLTRYECDYQTFLSRRDKNREVEAEQNRQFDDKLRKEEAWIRQGIKARRTRNEGRVRALKALRDERARRVSLRDMKKMQVERGELSGKIVKEVDALHYAIGEQLIVDHLDLIIQRGDRIGILGPNGCGKSTLLKLLLGELAPQRGAIKTGTKLKIAYFDQTRAQLNQDQSVFDYLAEGREFVDIGGKDLHVVTYLQNFLFNPDQSRAPIRSLSGGEQNRLLLAKLFTQPANLLVLDEPTNDLDIETLELLEAMLVDYDGTVLLVSHDRTFMDNAVSSLLVFEGNGQVTEYVGGYTDWHQQQTLAQTTTGINVSRDETATDYERRKKQKAAEQKRLRDLEKTTNRIEQVEADIDAMNTKLADSTFFEMTTEAQTRLYDEAAALEEELNSLMETWERLESDHGD